MRLKSCHIINFGKFSKKDIKFDDGLTSICRENVYGKIGNDDKTFANHNGRASLSYIKKAEVKDDAIEFLFENFTYSVILRQGKISDDFKITAEDGKIKAEMA